MSVDPEFADFNRSTVGRFLWRIENKRPVKQENTGKFHEGDAYLLLVSTQKGSTVDHKIHFWLGNECSSDEKGIVAYKAVELDDKLGGVASQLRETQGNESQLFESYYKGGGGIEYLPGGVESGFTHVERDVYETRLLHCKGSRTVRVNQVPIALASLNQDDAFILDMGMKIFTFFGPKANKYEKTKCLEVVRQINSDSRQGRAEVIRLEEDPQNAEFWDQFGGYVDSSALSPGEADDTVATFPPPQLLRVCDESGSVEVTPVPLDNGKLTKDKMDSTDAFIVVAQGKVFIWVGSKCTATEKREATANALKYMDNNGMDKATPLERVSDGCERAEFRALFAKWGEPMSFKGMQSQVAQSKEQPDIHLASIIKNKSQEDKPIEADAGSGKLTVYTIENMELTEIDPAMHGQFFSGDSYIIIYEFELNRRKKTIIYFWLGQHSTTDEKGACALHVKDIDDKRFGGNASQVRVVQGKEPSTLRSLFKGSFIVHSGGLASGFKNKNDVDTKDDDGVALFHVRGTTPLNTCGIQVEEVASQLNGEDCFVLVTPTTVYVWSGNAANDDEIAVATNIGTLLAGSYLSKSGRNIETIREGNEPDAFWVPLGGKTDYPAVAPGTSQPRDPRLFQGSTETGVFKLEEVVDFTQQDLTNDDVFLLDTYTQLFLWVGTGSTKQEREIAQQLTERYVTDVDDGRDEDMPIISVVAGNEGPDFTKYFVAWDQDYITKNAFIDPYAAKLASLKTAKENNSPSKLSTPSLKPSGGKIDIKAIASMTSSTPSPLKGDYATPSPGKYDLATLKAGLPAGVNPAAKEEWLSDAEFEACFKMSRADFAALAGWKRSDAKKKVGIF